MLYAFGQLQQTKYNTNISGRQILIIHNQPLIPTTSHFCSNVDVTILCSNWGYICASGHSCSGLVLVGPLPSESPLIKPSSLHCPFSHNPHKLS